MQKDSAVQTTTDDENACLKEEIQKRREEKAADSDQIEEMKLALEDERDGCGVLSRIVAHNSSRLGMLADYLRDNHAVVRLPGEDTVDAAIRCIAALRADGEEISGSCRRERNRLTRITTLVDGLHAVEILDQLDPEWLEDIADRDQMLLDRYEWLTKELKDLRVAMGPPEGGQ